MLARCPHPAQKRGRRKLGCPDEEPRSRRGGSACSHRSCSRRYQIPSSGPSIQRCPSLSSTARSRTASLNARGCKLPVRLSATSVRYLASASANGSTAIGTVSPATPCRGRRGLGVPAESSDSVGERGGV